MRRNIIGPMLHASAAIPVERPQDLAKKGAGKIVAIQDDRVLAEGAQFTRIKLKSILKVGKQELRVSEVISDNELITDSKDPKPIEAPADYKVIPKLEYE